MKKYVRSTSKFSAKKVLEKPEDEYEETYDLGHESEQYDEFVLTAESLGKMVKLCKNLRPGDVVENTLHRFSVIECDDEFLLCVGVSRPAV